MRWAMNWLFRGQGLKWIILFTLLYATWAVLVPNSILGLGFGLIDLIKLMVWYEILAVRTFRPLAGQLIRDLAITPFGHTLVWPGLLAAPVAASIVFGTIRFLCQMLGLVTPSPFDEFFGNWWASLPPQTGSDFEVMRLMASTPGVLVTAVLSLATGVLWWMAVTAFVTRMAMPEGGVIRVIFFLIVASIIIGLPSTVISNLLQYLAKFLSAGIFPAIATFLVSWIVSVVASYLLYFYSLGSLRSAPAWNLLTDKVRRDS